LLDLFGDFHLKLGCEVVQLFDVLLAALDLLDLQRDLIDVLRVLDELLDGHWRQRDLQVQLTGVLAELLGLLEEHLRNEHAKLVQALHRAVLNLLLERRVVDIEHAELLVGLDVLKLYIFALEEFDALFDDLVVFLLEAGDVKRSILDVDLQKRLQEDGKTLQVVEGLV